MAGADKGLVALAGRPMIAHVIAAMREQAGGIVIGANRNRERYGRLGHPVLSDTEPGFAGPLAGIAALMAGTEAPWLLVVPCDSPVVPTDLGPRLWHAARAEAADAAVVQIHGRLQPVFALLHRRLYRGLRADLAAGCRKTGDWLRTQNMVAVDFSDCAERFVNVNTDEERGRLAQLLTPEHPGARSPEVP